MQFSEWGGGIAMKATAEVLNAPRHRRIFSTEQLRNERIELSFLPEFGCHWSRLRLSVKGEWADFLKPVPDGDSLIDSPTSHGSYVMAPWSNRIAAGLFEFQGKRYQLQKNFRDGTAIHGDVRTRPWSVVDSTADRFEAQLDSRDVPEFNFPFPLRFQQVLELEGDRLRVEFTTTNAGDRAAPAGLGFHPFVLRRLTWRDDDVILVLPAEKVYPAVGCIPTGPAQPVEGSTDLRGLRRLGSPGLDHCFTGLTGREIRIIYRGSRVEVRFEVDESFGHAVIYAPNTKDGTPNSFVAVEPVTNANDGFNLLAKGWKETGVRVLSPGESWTARWQISMGDV